MFFLDCFVPAVLAMTVVVLFYRGITGNDEVAGRLDSSLHLINRFDLGQVKPETLSGLTRIGVSRCHRLSGRTCPAL